MCDVRGKKIGPDAVDEDGIEWSGRAWRRLMAEVEHASDEAEDGAERGVARTRVSNSFPTDAVLCDVNVSLANVVDNSSGSGQVRMLSSTCCQSKSPHLGGERDHRWCGEVRQRICQAIKGNRTR